ncbi:hypothetical protein SpCBS45565_g02139 [Spizellomyces sp. 'palustris']|nr:hypothetical protein SpCBS45565_g02139 [Spizellomyces sp. 'palustris']
MSTQKTTFLLNWAPTPYHIPIYLAQKLGFFARENLTLAILEPSDPSDVTELIGSGKIDMGCKAMIHTIAAKARGYGVTSVGTLLDEPFTGIVYLKHQGRISEDIASLKGKKIGYVGEFGKVIVDELMRRFGMSEEDYTAVRVGMNVTSALNNSQIDGGIGLENIQQVQLEHHSASLNLPPSNVGMLRIDELAELGCCCFCSVLYIANDTFIKNNPEKVRGFMRAVRSAMDYILANPKEAWKLFVEMKPAMDSPVNYSMYERSAVYFSKTAENVHRDWAKVTNYAKHLGVVQEGFKPNYTNEFIPDLGDMKEKVLAEADGVGVSKDGEDVVSR